jgi:hypothetical protein
VFAHLLFIRFSPLARHPMRSSHPDSSLHRPPRRLRRIDELKIDWCLAENANDERRRLVFLHAVIVRRVRNAAHKTAGRRRHGRVWFESFARRRSINFARSRVHLCECVIEV